MFKRSPAKPIVTITVNGVMESFYTGKAFLKEVWKHHHEYLKNENYKIKILFGHKFFHWCNNNNKKIWIKNEGRDISFFDDWNYLKGELIFSKKLGRAIGIKIEHIN